MVRKIIYQFSKLKNPSMILIFLTALIKILTSALSIIIPFFTQLINLCGRQSEYFSEFTYYGIELKCGVRAHKRHVILAVAFKYIIDDLITIKPGKVDIEVR